MKSFFISAIIAITLPSFAIGEESFKRECFDSYNEAAEYSVKDKMWYDQLEFKTADITTVQGKTIVIKSGKAYHTGDAMMVFQIFSPSGSKAVVTTKLKVENNVITEKSFCASHIQAAI